MGPTLWTPPPQTIANPSHFRPIPLPPPLSCYLKTLKKSLKKEFPVRPGGLRIWRRFCGGLGSIRRCHSCSVGRSRGWDSDSGPGTYLCRGCGHQRKKKDFDFGGGRPKTGRALQGRTCHFPPALSPLQAAWAQRLPLPMVSTASTGVRASAPSS